MSSSHEWEAADPACLDCGDMRARVAELGSAVKALLPPHSGLCCTFDAAGAVAVTQASCKCPEREHLARILVGEWGSDSVAIGTTAENGECAQDCDAEGLVCPNRKVSAEFIEAELSKRTGVYFGKGQGNESELALQIMSNPDSLRRSGGPAEGPVGKAVARETTPEEDSRSSTPHFLSDYDANGDLVQRPSEPSPDEIVEAARDLVKWLGFLPYATNSQPEDESILEKVITAENRLVDMFEGRPQRTKEAWTWEEVARETHHAHHRSEGWVLAVWSRNGQWCWEVYTPDNVDIPRTVGWHDTLDGAKRSAEQSAEADMHPRTDSPLAEADERYRKAAAVVLGINLDAVKGAVCLAHVNIARFKDLVDAATPTPCRSRH